MLIQSIGMKKCFFSMNSRVFIKEIPAVHLVSKVESMWVTV